MRRQRTVNAHKGAGAKVVMGEEQAGELACALGVFPIGHERIGGCGRHEEGRSRRGGAKTPEPSATCASQIEDAKVQARRSLDEDRLLVSCVHADRYRVPLCTGAVKSLRTTLPPFITNLTRCSSVMSASGLPETATRSANLPLAIDPI
jgi:hypothetical protein